MSVFSVKSDPTAPVTRFDGVDAYIAQANSSTEAKALAKGAQAGDADALWTAATVEDLSATPALTGWVFRVQVNTSTPTDVSVTGDSDDTLDAVAAKLVTALLAAGHGTAHASYNSTTNVLTVAVGGSDALGDKNITITVTPPTGLFSSDYAWAQSDVVASVTELGMSSADLKITFSTTWVVPGAIHGYKQ